MSRPSVVLTGAGGAAMPSLIRHLRARGHRVVACDMRADAPGLLYADAARIVPAGGAPGFAAALAAICREEGAAVAVPLVDEELVPACALENEGIAVVLPRRAFVETCLDKHALMRALAAADIPVPETRLLPEGTAGLRFPLVVKPRTGRGSRGLHRCADAAALAELAPELAGPAESWLLQEEVQGPEYTVSAVCWRDGALRAVVPKLILDKRGITWRAVTRREPRIDALCAAVAERLFPGGPFNVQLRIDERTGAALAFEINPRFSTTVVLTLAAGLDEVGLLVDLAAGLPDGPVPAWREGVHMVRHLTEWFGGEDDLPGRAPRGAA